MIADGSIRHSLVLLLGNGLRLGLGFVATILLARALTPTDFGTYSLIMNLVLTISAFGDLGLNWAFVRLYPQNNDPVSASTFLRGTITLRLLTSCFLFLLCIAVLPSVSTLLFGFADLDPWLIRLGCLVILLWGALSFVMAILQSEGKFSKLSLVNTLINVIRLVILGLLWMFGRLTTYTAVGVFVFSLAVAGLVSVIEEPTYRPAFGRKTFSGWLSQFFYWSRWNFFHQVSNVALVKLDVLLLGYLGASNAVVGNYSLSFTFASVAGVLQMSTNTYLLPEASRITTIDHLEVYFRKVARLALVALPVLLVIGVLSFPIVHYLYGDKYPDAAEALLPLLGGFAVSLCASPIVLLAFPLNKPQISGFCNILGIVVLGVSAFWLIPQQGVQGTGIAVLLSRLVAEGSAVAAVLFSLKKSPFEREMSSKSEPIQLA